MTKIKWPTTKTLVTHTELLNPISR